MEAINIFAILEEQHRYLNNCVASFRHQIACATERLEHANADWRASSNSSSVESGAANTDTVAMGVTPHKPTRAVRRLLRQRCSRLKHGLERLVAQEASAARGLFETQERLRWVGDNYYRTIDNNGSVAYWPIAFSPVVTNAGIPGKLSYGFQ